VKAIKAHQTVAPHPQAEKHRVPTLHLIRPVPELIAGFPPTRYCGSKRKLLGWIYGHLGAIRFDNVLDAFGGTGSVSMLFKAMRKSVTYHDGFRFNEDVARTVLAPRPALARQEVAAMLDAVEPCAGVISKHFSGIFFLNHENEWLDGFIAQLGARPSAPEAKALLNHLIYQACLKKRPFNLFHRANLGLRTNQSVKRSFGNAVTWERSFVHHALQTYDELAGTPAMPGPPVTVLAAGDVVDITPGYDLVYIDPPYINREDRYNRDDYWRRYHFLEGLARFDHWATLIDTGSDIRLFPPPPWFAEWGRTATFKDRLFAFIDAHRDSIVALSYVSDAVPSETEITRHFETRFKQISVHSRAHHHALSKASKRELMFIGFPK
jgi:adenine-specific DNA-methyltransferase